MNTLKGLSHFKNRMNSNIYFVLLRFVLTPDMENVPTNIWNERSICKRNLHTFFLNLFPFGLLHTMLYPVHTVSILTDIFQIHNKSPTFWTGNPDILFKFPDEHLSGIAMALRLLIVTKKRSISKPSSIKWCQSLSAYCVTLLGQFY